MPDGSKRRRRNVEKNGGNKAKAAWYAKHRQIRFTKRFGI